MGISILLIVAMAVSFEFIIERWDHGQGSLTPDTIWEASVFVSLRADLVTRDPDEKKSSCYSKLNCKGIPPPWIL
jgi:hypothetical protein